MTSDHPTPESACLNCGYRVDAATGVNTADRPAPGDLSICLRCGAVAVYADDLTLRGMTESEMDRLCADTVTMKYLASQVRNIQLMPKLN